MAPTSPDTEELVEQAGRGDASARQQLLVRHRKKLRRMVTVQLDHRLAARVDPSDVVQDVLVDAAQRLSGYLRRRPLPFYAWLRQIAWERLIQVHRHHLRAQRRSVAREEPWPMTLSDDSVRQLANRLLSREASPIRRMIRDELGERLRTALAGLSPRDREVLVMRHLEQLAVEEIASVLGISAGAVMTRHTRALMRLRKLLDDDRPEESQ
jgi:RNA polymerase sigma-70 factor (ECF subfamily)